MRPWLPSGDGRLRNHVYKMAKGSVSQSNKKRLKKISEGSRSISDIQPYFIKNIPVKNK